MSYVMVLEKDATAIEILCLQIKNRLGFDSEIAHSIKELEDLYIQKETKPVAVIIDIRLTLGNYTPLQGVPTILITHDVPVQTRMMLSSYNLLDYVTNYHNHNCNYIISLLQRIHYREKLQVMIIERDSLMLSMISRNINSLGINTENCPSIKEGWEMIERGHKFHQIFISVNEAYNEVQFIKHLREHYNKQELHLIALLGEGSTEEFEIELYHAGVNSCIEKKLSTPLSLEHFQLRTLQSIREIITYQEMQFLAQRDSMTGAINRRHFYEIGENIFANYLRGNLQLSVAMLDIDNFKNVNDTHGHPVGDAVIITLSAILNEEVRTSDLVARFGGEEFCILLTGTDTKNSMLVMERIRHRIETAVVETEEASIEFTVSIGLSCKKEKTLEDMIIAADQNLYKAKESGKNRVVTDCSDPEK